MDSLFLTTKLHALSLSHCHLSACFTLNSATHFSACILSVCHTYSFLSPFCRWVGGSFFVIIWSLFFLSLLFSPPCQPGFISWSFWTAGFLVFFFLFFGRWVGRGHTLYTPLAALTSTYFFSLHPTYSTSTVILGFHHLGLRWANRGVLDLKEVERENT
ncbi:hypothetical protein FN846DRAFT_223054 [Sphaerosporella brunnea]|uniref:Uncharacterized protein n=1 Tax=Sphaerosporella brunnea TaxID=1250544 RepID=A0A5J5EMA5_9PEZI|nr:hypothetical protein FN846DRAFT_223054 [Sphaerosporella brunnea]